MSEKKAASIFGIGALTVLVVLLCLCLTIFGVLTLTTAQADARLGAKQEIAVSSYYKVDARTAILCSTLAEMGKAAPPKVAECLAALQKVDGEAAISLEKQGTKLCCLVSLHEGEREYNSAFDLGENGTIQIKQWCIPQTAAANVDASLPVFGSD